MTAFLRPDGLASYRTVLTYLALLAGVFTFLPGFSYLTTALACLAIVLGWANLRMVARVIFSLILILGGLALAIEPVALERASGNMARIGALIITVMLLSAVLAQSNDIKIISRSLFSGRPAHRYLGVTTGTAVLSVPLNFGAVGVIATMIGVQIRERGDSGLARNAARAVVRGFGASPMASPLSIAIVMVVTFLPGLSSWKLIAASLPFAALYLVAGAVFREQEAPESKVVVGAVEGAGPAWVRFLSTIALICLGAFALTSLAGLIYSQAVTLSCLTAVVLGLLYRRIQDGKLFIPSLAMMNNELAIMGGSSFLGGVIGTFALNWMGSDFSLPVWAYPLVAMLVPWLFFAGGAVGVNPIISGTLSSSILGPIWPDYGLLALGFGIVTGWGITIAGTPFSANALLLERCTGYNTRVAAYDWSFRYSVISLAVSSLICGVLALPF